jgi:ubiquinone/menaquinone biosynthesis C-methylase UbiE
MDMQTSMLSKVQKKAEKENLNNIEYLHAGLGEGKLTANHFDRALLVTVLGEIPDQKRALQEIFNSLKPNGIISITETIFDPHYQSIESVMQLAFLVGFKEKKRIANFFAFTLLLEKPITNY